MSDLEKRLRSYVAERLNVDESQISSDARLVEDLGADSLDAVELVMGLEEKFGLDIPDQEAEKILTFGDILNFAKARL